MNFYEDYLQAVRCCEYNMEHSDRWIVKDPNSSLCGTWATFEMLGEVWDISRVVRSALLYSCEDSKYYRSENMLEILKFSCRAALSKLHEDGTADLLISNFHTAEQFGLNSVASATQVMKAYLCGTESEREAYSLLTRLVRRLCDGCLNSGFHTPNHRWVETSGLLMACDALDYQDCEKYLEKAKKYMAEGIDCDEEGEYSERSAGMYNRHCDKVFLEIYSVTQDSAYLDAVCRNLDLMQYYINDDFSMFTQNSRRKDKGEVGSVPLFLKATTYYADIYFDFYMLAAYFAKKPLFAGIAAEISKDALTHGRSLPRTLDYFMKYPELKTYEFDIENCHRVMTYEKYQPKSNIVRIKRDQVTFSFFAENPSFLQIEAPGLKMSARMCASFFAVAQFIPEKLEKTEVGYRLHMRAHGDYKLPLDDPDESTKDYWSIDPARRRAIQELDLNMTVTAAFYDNGVELSVSAVDCDRVPFKFEIAVNEGLLCEIGDAAMTTHAGAMALGKTGSARFESAAGTVMTVDGLFCKHMYVENMRGSLPPMEGAFTLYLSDFTPVERKININFAKADGTRVFS